MKRTLTYIATALTAVFLSACVDIRSSNPYGENLSTTDIHLDMGGSTVLEGVTVKAEDVINAYTYTAVTDSRGTASFRLPDGLYRFSAGYRDGSDIYNGTVERVNVSGERSFEMSMIHSFLGPVVIKEIYCGGCKLFGPDGEFLDNYQSDKYAILHNNSGSVYYLDGLCLGVLAPYNSSSSLPLKGVKTASGKAYMDVYAPIIQAVWQFGGNGTDFPLAPGEDAVVAFCGAVDHTVQYPNSINLNKEDYFVCYNNTYFWNERYHPAPGDRIRDERILECIVKLGQANAYTVSINSPAMVIFRPEGMTAKEYLVSKPSSGDDPVMQLPGSGADKIMNVPWDWVTDAVEVFSSMSGNKRIGVMADAGYVILSDTYLGHTLMRRTDDEASAAAGYEVLLDTNNSSEDFYEREKQSLHE